MRLIGNLKQSLPKLRTHFRMELIQIIQILYNTQVSIANTITFKDISVFLVARDECGQLGMK
jgi:hypothetical protein